MPANFRPPEGYHSGVQQPLANHEEAAKCMKSRYDAYRAAGFTDEQAFELVKIHLAGIFAKA